MNYGDDDKIYGKFSIVLELGGANLKSYIQQNIVNINDEDDKSEFITKVAGGATHALRRFHKCLFIKGNIVFSLNERLLY